MVQARGATEEQDRMTARGEEIIRVPVAAVRRIHAALENEGEAASIDEIEVECVACGIRISGAELKQLGEANDLPEKLDRLRLEYCARKSCESRFYNVIVRARPASVRETIVGLANLLPALHEKPRWFQMSGRFLIQGASTGIAVLLTLFLLYHWYYGGRIPLLQRPHHYQAEAPARP